MRPRTLYRTLAIAEAITWTMLLGGILLRALDADLAWAVTIGGGTHGFVFLAYGTMVVLVAVNQRWRAGPTLVSLASAVIPYATIPVEIWHERSARLRGEWRLEAGDDPRDQRPVDRFLRWWLRRPRLLAGVLIVVVAIAFVALLFRPR